MGKLVYKESNNFTLLKDIQYGCFEILFFMRAEYQVILLHAGLKGSNKSISMNIMRILWQIWQTYCDFFGELASILV